MNDTHPEAERVQIELLRKAGPERRLAMACELTDQVMSMSKAAIARAHPEMASRDRELLFIEVHYGRKIAQWVRGLMQAEAAA